MPLSTQWLVIVDVQNDFVEPHGALPVPNGVEIVQRINDKLLKQHAFDLIVKSRDWHPKEHISFNTYKEPDATLSKWPPHAIKGTHGAEFYPSLPVTPMELIVSKGVSEKADSKSAFGDRSDVTKAELKAHYERTGEWLKPSGYMEDTGLGPLVLSQASVPRIYVCGFATDVCVRATVLDSLDLGLETFVVSDCCGGLSPECQESTLEELKAHGAKMVTSNMAF
eukprot:Blabericola_migrator_1__10566@NODE_5_length_29060_cov_171_088642_g4_i0_p16_GENE_NODE_5_length_29060_cov_171_088642_g4_i0NODE_5_length_29060_cov_171_088642_g4_i0_p16_ORF_typecomplete_len224_score36_71Isochorismatase/PF00857_20/1_4e40_NODE_5_length_29060_cov_171_088642_g4_i01221312884